MSILDELQIEITRIREATGPSVVGIANPRGAGSGIIIAKDTVLTNAHNVWGDEVEVTFADGRTETGTVSGADVDGDIAVVHVPTEDAQALAWDGGTVAIGSPVFALSNPGGRGLRVTFGFVSGTERSFRGPRGRRIAGSLEHTAPLLPGSSGGPVVDTSGTLVGINTNRLGEGFYLAIPTANGLRARVDKLAKGESTDRPRLGVAIAPSHVARRLRRAVGLPEVDGVLVRGV
ncbi:MAG: S1C family serine protease, partial [Actinomycetota bacterium]